MKKSHSQDFGADLACGINSGENRIQRWRISWLQVANGSSKLLWRKGREILSSACVGTFYRLNTSLLMNLVDLWSPVFTICEVIEFADKAQTRAVSGPAKSQ